MSDFLSRPCTAFASTRKIAEGPLVDVALAVKAAAISHLDAPVLVFEDSTGAVIDLDLRGSTAEIISRLTDREKQDVVNGTKPHKNGEAASPLQSRGRPKLGVVAREVTLLPRHWEWLAAQRGGASQTLRRLVDEARRVDSGESLVRAAQEASYRFISAMAGDLPGFEGAARALFARDEAGFARWTAEWPEDVRLYAQKLAYTTSHA